MERVSGSKKHTQVLEFLVDDRHIHPRRERHLHVSHRHNQPMTGVRMGFSSHRVQRISSGEARSTLSPDSPSGIHS